MLREIHATPPEDWPARYDEADWHHYAEVMTGDTPVTAIKGVIIQIHPWELWQYLDGGAGFWWAPKAYIQFQNAHCFIRGLRQTFPGAFPNKVPIAVITPSRNAEKPRRRQLSTSVTETSIVGSKLRVVDYA